MYFCSLRPTKMYSQIRQDTLFIMLYAVVTATALLASCYLLFRRANAIAPNITPPIHLRRWTTAFFAFFALNHLWYMPIFFLSSSEAIMMTDLIGGLLDCMTLFPVAVIVLLAMLQDHKRPLWPVAVMVTPIVVAGAFSVATRSYALLPMVYVYSLLTCMGLIIYMVRALERYGRWLRDNFADLEHKEVWQSFVVLTIIMLVFGIYAFVSEGPVYQYAMQVIILVLVFYLLWRVETLSDLSLSQQPESLPVEEAVHAKDEVGDCQSPPTADNSENQLSNGLSQTTCANIKLLLQKYCIDTQLYLQHDLNLSQLAHAIGTNRTYLTNYFIHQGITYNAYINDLRINHFINLYREAAATESSITAQQLSHDSGYRSYSTFSLAFKQRMGQTVTAWMRNPTV